MLSRLLLLVPLLMLAAYPNAGARTPKPETSTQALHRLFRQAWDREMREHPLEASDLGDRRFNDRWPDLSLIAIGKSHELDEQTLSRLAAIDRNALSPADKVNYDLFKWKYTDRVGGYRFHGYLFPFNQLGGLPTISEYADSLRFKTRKDYADWLTRLEHIDRFADQNIALLEEGVKEHRTMPRVVMERIPAQIASQIVAAPEKSPFYAPFLKIPADIPDATAAKLQQRARAVIGQVVIPAYRHFQQYFTQQYLPNCRTRIGASALPDGKAYYTWLARHFTTTGLNPEQIHRIGLEKVREIHTRMLDVIKAVGFKGSFDDFLHDLRTNPHFYYKDPQQLLEGYRNIAKRIDPELVKLFGHLPRTPYGIKPVPANLAPDTYPAYYYPPAADGSRAGYMYVNLYKPETRPKYEMEVLTSHEAVPGHHLQIALAMELGNLPKFRRYGEFTAFTEGWALYSETLGYDLGLYKDPYSRFGQLSYQMWRAVRLVVDTGIHYEGWSRERAVRFFQENTALTSQNINTEVDRYIAWPGQALAYMIGEIRMQQLRDEARSRLGSRFDIKTFHDKVLSNGSIPLAVLQTVIEDWIRTQAKRQRTH